MPLSTDPDVTNAECTDSPGAEPSPAYFNILMHGDEPEMMDGTQLAADWTFSGLQKFGQGLEERLKGLKLPSKLLEKVRLFIISLCTHTSHATCRVAFEHTLTVSLSG